MGLLSNRVSRESLKTGDHIYSWRAAYIYAHHGIYIGDEKVVHFTRGSQEVGAGTVLDRLSVSSMPTKSYVPCLECTTQEEHGVVLSCLNCFLAGGVLHRFEYDVHPALFLAKRGGTCTLAAADQNDIVVHRAKYLLEHGFGCYNLFKNNCEDFAIYCKTGLLVVDQGMGKSGQAASIIGGPLAAVLSTPLRLVTTNVYGMAATAVGVYCVSRYATDIGVRKDVVKVTVENMTERLASSLHVVEAQEVDVENIVAIASQLIDESIEAREVDVAHSYIQAVGMEPENRPVYGLGTHASSVYLDSVSSSSSASSHYSTLFDVQLREELQDIQENLQRKNEELQQKNEEMQKQIEEMKKREEESLKREKEMQQKIEQIEQIMRIFTQGSSTSQPSAIDPNRSP